MFQMRSSIYSIVWLYWNVGNVGKKSSGDDSVGFDIRVHALFKRLLVLIVKFPVDLINFREAFIVNHVGDDISE